MYHASKAVKMPHMKHPVVLGTIKLFDKLMALIPVGNSDPLHSACYGVICNKHIRLLDTKNDGRFECASELIPCLF